MGLVLLKERESKDKDDDKTGTSLRGFASLQKLSMVLQ
jgi:hypothetical protein